MRYKGETGQERQTSRECWPHQEHCNTTAIKAPIAQVPSVMQHASGSTSDFQASQPLSAWKGMLMPTGTAKDAAGATDEGTPPSEGEVDALGREGLLGKLQRTVSFSLSRISSIVPASNASRRRKSSVGADAVAAVAEGGQEGCDAEASSPALEALMPFVPLMFRRDLLLPDPTFSALRVIA